jgi:hypothetical protein
VSEDGGIEPGIFAFGGTISHDSKKAFSLFDGNNQEA